MWKAQIHTYNGHRPLFSHPLHTKPQLETQSASDTIGVNLVWNLRCRGSGSTKFRFFHSNFLEISIFSGNFPQKCEFSRNFFLNFDFFRQFLKNFRFSRQKLLIYRKLFILFIFKIRHFRTYFLYMIRYKIRPRPPRDPPLRLPTTLCLKSGRDTPIPLSDTSNEWTWSRLAVPLPQSNWRHADCLVAPPRGPFKPQDIIRR